MKRREGGFTLLELLIVIAIAGIVMGIGFVNLRPLSGDLRNNASRAVNCCKPTKLAPAPTRICEAL